ncbi:precorrin-2 dehydrogenase/sirohydrochlorin ferrochelatase family protein [Sphingomonas crocodyli]|uniref:precorrin-2 dehydrogenase n=1 Tax=Sphingomonas crocodyli TaxID=1979270 RepID=A0A437M4J9_9SPHN|nr:bifunctional precorrin-2 dehydrogenase/sirohydrochlorin ferrochelatase [Sphingomonas crocodyli]RVT92650.1 siroheme synthase [Sphingomonas crocodyli]
MHSLPIFVALKGRPVILIGAGPAADAKRRLLERAGADIVDESATAALAIVADGDEAAAARLRARGVLINVTDRPDLCDFTLPAIVDRDPVLIAIGTGGTSAGLAKVLRQRIEALLPATLGKLATALYAAQPRIRDRWPQADDRRHAIDAALAGPLDPIHGKGDVDAWLDASKTPAETGLIRLHLRSDDPDDLTLREARLLGRADRIYHRPEAPAAILNRARADAERIACAAPPDALPPGLSIDLETA